jgi:hypothetical protein
MVGLWCRYLAARSPSSQLIAWTLPDGAALRLEQGGRFAHTGEEAEGLGGGAAGAHGDARGVA